MQRSLVAISQRHSFSPVKFSSLHQLRIWPKAGLRQGKRNITYKVFVYRIVTLAEVGALPLTEEQNGIKIIYTH